MRVAPLFERALLLAEPRRVVGDDPHVALCALDLLRQLRGVEFARDLLALLAPDGVVQQNVGVFQFAEARARARCRLIGEDEVGLEYDSARAQFAHLALEGQKARAVLGDERPARREDLTADGPLAFRRHAHLLSR